MLEQYSLATLLDPRYKNCFFSKRVAKDQAEAALLRVLKAEVSAEPVSNENSGNELMHAEPAEGLAGVLQQLRDRGSQARAGEGEERTQPEEHFIQKYLNAQLETVSCLKHWEKVERTPGLHKVDRALCRLARYDFLRLFSFFYISIILGGTSPHHQHLLMWRGCSPRLGDLLKTTVPECYQRTWKNCCS